MVIEIKDTSFYGDAKGNVSKERLISEPLAIGPHVVILGAGASVAAFPDGDANGKELPTMDNLVKVVDGLEKTLIRSRINYRDRNFEDLYSEIHETAPESPMLSEVNSIIWSYFSKLQLPEAPTIYDYLILSLRPKDVIATFNWDPFLFDTWSRIQDEVDEEDLPRIVHLHGNVRIGYCAEHMIQGGNGLSCSECGGLLSPSPLLYPIVGKNYDKDIFIQSQWKEIRNYLEDAFAFTVFGYGAPKTDLKAVELIEFAWKARQNRQYKTTEFIDKKDANMMKRTWEPYWHHSRLRKGFFESYISLYPRRTCEALYAQTIKGCFAEKYPIPEKLKCTEFYSWYKPLLAAE